VGEISLGYREAAREVLFADAKHVFCWTRLDDLLIGPLEAASVTDENTADIDTRSPSLLADPCGDNLGGVKPQRLTALPSGREVINFR